MFVTRINVCRCRHGKFHVVNNNYQGWGMYAIGGSENPTINSEGNRFFAPNGAKEVSYLPTSSSTSKGLK
jgi:pectate lyase